MSEKKKKNYQQKPRKETTCIYCGGKEFERLTISHVGVIQICKSCREEQ